MTRAIYRTTAALLAGYVALALAMGYWALALGPALLAREDNPRTVATLQRIPRGAIFDRNGAPLAESPAGPEPGTWQRTYPHPEAAPIVGYYSFKHGASGIEDSYNAVLLGLEGRDPATAAWDDLLHRLPAGRSVRLTIDSGRQRTAEQALGDHVGAIVVLDADSGDILALASHPTFDPNRLDDEFDALARDPAAPLLSRATQGSYQPGPALQPGLVAAALGAGLLRPAEVIAGAGTPLDLGLTLSCSTAAPAADLLPGEALALACPGLSSEIGRRLGAGPLDQLLAGLGYFAAPSLPLRMAVAERAQPPAGDRGLALAAAGQGDLTVTPLHIALVTAALARGGTIPAPRLVDAVQAPTGAWDSVTTKPGQPAFSAAAAAQVREWMRAAVAGTGPANGAAVNGVPVAGHAGIALSGGRAGVPEGLAWFAGFAPAADSGHTIVVTVLLEREDDARVAAQVARACLAP